VVAAGDESHQMRHYQSNKTDHANGSDRDSGCQSGRTENQIAKSGDRHADDSGLQFAATQYVQVSRGKGCASG
jgi:hypothetical protein